MHKPCPGAAWVSVQGIEDRGNQRSWPRCWQRLIPATALVPAHPARCRALRRSNADFAVVNGRAMSLHEKPMLPLTSGGRNRSRGRPSTMLSSAWARDEVGTGAGELDTGFYGSNSNSVRPACDWHVFAGIRFETGVSE